MADVSATVLKNKFSEVVRLASREPLAITRHNRREFVILTAERYEEIQQSRLAPLQSLSADFDQMVAKMNTAPDRKARASFFKASAVKPSPALAKLKKQRAHAR
ncbi:type II toxin-antitoxin system Phd/YefM family antitoxin [Synoicihabitans lomoniglobus]|uniref:Antitoxin n=2 Tax=Synoicihabitans lomoniglobus TaxID=2909285 RepID=A0AAF0CSQ9_9BACT|nr:type II toxin-antitoxin system Phd/YefM family antitoxin [Opitutaceae bacterium LMO-M01]